MNICFWQEVELKVILTWMNFKVRFGFINHCIQIKEGVTPL